MEFADTEVLRSHKGWKSSSRLSDPDRFDGRSRLLNLDGASAWRLRDESRTYQVVMCVGMIVLSGGVEPIIEFPMTDRAISHVLFGICVGVLDGK